MPAPRIEPLEPPYPEAVARLLAGYPQGPDGPIRLFRTLAHSERTLKKLGSAGLLDKGSPIDKRDREILILRTSFNRNTPYEWGIHVTAFSQWAGLDTAQVEDTCSRSPDDSLWSERDLLLLRVADELSDTSGLADDTWQALHSMYTTEQILEIVMLVGFYHMIAFLNNTLRVEQEPDTPTF